MLDAPSSTKSPMWAIVDIGSNSVRLVMYDGPQSTPLPVLNEKALCGLGDRDLNTGDMREEAMAEALSILRRFKSLIDSMRPQHTIVFATAAVREAPNGPLFLKDVAEIGFTPVILSGEEEARLAALGVLSAAPEILHRPGGAVSGDIGGGSLELCHIAEHHDGFLGPRISLPLGGLRLATKFADDLPSAHQFIERSLDEVTWLETCDASAFYIVGGAWRTLGRIAIADNRYPLEMLDHYTLSRREVAQLIDRVLSTSVDDLASLTMVQRRRAPTLPYAAMVLKSIFDRLGAERIVVSACGVREGLIFDRLPTDAQYADPLDNMTRYFANTSRASIVPSAECIWRFLEPALSVVQINNVRLWKAAIRLSHTSLMHHPELRAERSAVSAMGMPIRGLTHRERAMLASSLYFRHGGRTSDLYSVVPVGLMSEDDIKVAKCVGVGIRFALELDPNGRTVLPRAHLALNDENISVHIHKIDMNFWGRGPAKRFGRFAAMLSREAIFPPSVVG